MADEAAVLRTGFNALFMGWLVNKFLVVRKDMNGTEATSGGPASSVGRPGTQNLATQFSGVLRMDDL